MLAILWRFKSQLAIILLLASVFGYGAYKGYSVEHTKLVAETSKYDSLVEAIKKERMAWEAKIDKITKDLNEENVRINVAAEQKFKDQRTAYDRALSQLRNDSKRAALKPAEAAPAECRSYEASPVQLPVYSAEVVLWLGAEADRLAGLLQIEQAREQLINKAINENAN